MKIKIIPILLTLREEYIFFWQVDILLACLFVRAAQVLTLSSAHATYWASHLKHCRISTAAAHLVSKKVSEEAEGGREP